ncbi:MAG: hypothetical protein JWN44_5027 [Myxococcales bacterium]|nr:hypothetical protein [Myxococcales bacterium]
MKRLVLAGLLLLGGRVRADDRGDAHAALQLYVQPAPGDTLVVITPSASAHVNATGWLAFDAEWLADVVTGATPRTYGPADVISAATQFSETRNLVGVAAEATWRMLTLLGGYSFGNESDYRSHLLRANLKADLLQHNTVLAASYSHGFDSVCNLANQESLAVTLRQPLDRSTGCFSGNPQLTEESVGIDSAELSWVQTLSPRWAGTLVGSYQHLSGFQSNPYRTVRLSGGLFLAQESHPRVRDRGAVTARVRYAIAEVHGTLGFDLRLYRDTWGIQSLTGEASYEQPFRQARPAWRFGVRARGYVQSGAIFFRDVTAADSYDRSGPVGSFFTADQALAPLADLLLGARATWAGYKATRYWRAFTDMDASVLVNWTKVFALTPDPPNVARTQGWASAILLGLSASGRF